MVKVYLNLEICTNIRVINNPEKFEMYAIRKLSDSFPKHYRALAPTGH
jgi:hypothetical protein